MNSPSCTPIAPGVWRLDLGRPETWVPSRVVPPQPDLDGLAALPSAPCPLDPDAIHFRTTQRGFEVRLPLASDEHLYGLGLQLLSLEQTGLKKALRVNSDPRSDMGDSHAPVPFYLSTAGYGVLVDTARYATFYCGSARSVTSLRHDSPHREVSLDGDAIYAAHKGNGTGEMTVEIPGAEGISLFLFAGPSLGAAVQRYNLFSGGGCLPPRWALGIWYRTRSDFDDKQVFHLANDLRSEGIPCDVLGLEPGWQSHAYPCSHEWNAKFPHPAEFVASLRDAHFQVNLWTHAFTHPNSPLFPSLLPHAGDHAVFSGLVPDFSVAEAERLFADHYRKTGVGLGISGYKLDECDNSDYINFPWSFPEYSRFPSGADGEQMHSLFGLLQQRTVDRLYRNDGRRTFGLVRSSQAFAAPLPFALYSDLYDHRQFVRGIVTSSLCGLLWAPEVREAASGPELVRRLQSAVLSPLAQINTWYIKNPPWKQWDVTANNRDEFLPDWPHWEERCRAVLEWRMRLLPYLHSAFYRYWKEGIPPFRAMVFDYPGEKESWRCDDQFLIGDRLLAAPFLDGTEGRPVWLPPGQWIGVDSGRSWEGGQIVHLSQLDGGLPLFVKQNSLLPLAPPTLHTEDPESMRLEVRVYGDGSLPITFTEEHDPALPTGAGNINLATLQWIPSNRQLVVERQNPHLPPLYTFSPLPRRDA